MSKREEGETLDTQTQGNSATLSWVPTTTTTTNALTIRDFSPNQQLGGLFPMATPLYVESPSQRKEAIPSMRLVRYTVVDPDERLAEERPDLCVIDSDSALSLEISEKILNLLPAHNEARLAVTYEDDDGKERTLRAIRIGQLDVVLETLKTY